MELTDELRSVIHDLEHSVEQRFPSNELTRIHGFFRVLRGEEQPVYEPGQQPRLPYLFVPGLPSRPFIDTQHIDFIQRLEAAAGDIRRELEGILPNNRAEFSPYSSTPGWDAYFLVRGFQEVEANTPRFPKTLEALRSFPVVLEAYFAILRPHAKIPRHTDPTNFVLATHLSLVAPRDCAIRVGDEVRGWEEGRCLLLDTSYWHEAWNHSDGWRINLNIDTWHPALTSTERQVLQWVGHQLFPVLQSELRPPNPAS